MTSPLTAVAADPDSLGALYRRERGPIVQAVLPLVGSRSRAEEVAQDAFLVAHRRSAHVLALDRPGAWIRRVALNLALKDHGRRATASSFLAERCASPAFESSLVEHVVLHAAIAELTHQQRAAVQAFYLEDLPIATVARRLGCESSTVRVHLHRARDTLARQLVALSDATS